MMEEINGRNRALEKKMWCGSYDGLYDFCVFIMAK